MSLKKKIISTIIFKLLLTLAYFFVFKGYSFKEFQNTLENCDKIYLIIAGICVLLWVFFESLYFKYILKKLNYKISWYQAIGYVFTESYFSAITPSSTGGQPMQMMEMNKDNIPYRISSIVVLINTFLYKIALFVILILGSILYCNELKFFSTTFKVFAILGFLVTLLLVILFIAIVFSKNFSSKLANFIYKIFKKLRIKKYSNSSMEKLNQSIEEYREAAVYIKSNKKILITSFLILFMQRISLLTVNFLVYKAFHVNGISLPFAIVIQAFITIAADFFPLPGGVIISEAFIIETNELLGITSIAKSATLVLRNISFYFLVLVSLIYYLIFHFAKRKKAIKTTKKDSI